MQILKSKRQSGSVLMITLVTGAIIGFTLASYLTLINSQNRSILRSTSWNTSLAYAEAGVEETLTHLNINCLSNPISARTVNWAADGWTQISSSPNVYERRRWFGDTPGKLGWYTVRLTNSNSKICNFSVIGASPVPEAHAYNQHGALLAQVSSSSAVRYSVRQIFLRATIQQMFPMGMVAKGLIDMNGNNVNVDSFDSRSNQFSTFGAYDPGKRKDGGSVGTNLGLTNSLSIGNANIYGSAATGPGGTVSIGSGGGVGSFQYQSTNSGTVQPGKFTDDMNVDFPDVESPIGGGTISPLLNQRVIYTNVSSKLTVVGSLTNLVTTTNIVDERYDMVFETGDYHVGSLDGKILVKGNARVEVTSSIALTGQEGITIVNGATLALYMKGQSASFGGNGVVNNGGNATNFAYYGMPSNTSIDLKGNAAFTGTIYAPSAHLHMGGGGRDNTDFSGASITASVKMNGHFNFHYDEALGSVGPLKNYVIERWKEVAPPAESAIVSYKP